MKHIGLLILFVTAISVAACARDKRAVDNRVTLIGSGNMVSQEAAVTDFDRLEIDLAFDVTVRQGKEFRVTATVDDNLADYLRLVTTGSTLRIGLKPGFAYDIPAATMRAEVIMPQLAGLILNGSSRAKLVDVKVMPGFTAELSGASVLEGRVEAEAAGFTLSGSTATRLSGAGQQVDVDICGNSTIDLRKFRVVDARLKASCNALVFLELDGQLEADASQRAQIIYRGQPELRGVKMVQSASVRPE